MNITRDEAITGLVRCILNETGRQSMRLCEVLAEADRATPDEIAERLTVQRQLNSQWREEVEDTLRKAMALPSTLPPTLQ